MKALVQIAKSKEFGEVEIILVDGEPLFNANHVARVLGIEQVRSTIRDWNEKYRKVLKNSDVHAIHYRKLNNKGETFLTEAGLYKLIFQSRKPNAERFQDWVVSEVLPSIRKYGYYTLGQDKPDPMLTLLGLEKYNVPFAIIRQVAEIIKENRHLLKRNSDLEVTLTLLKHSGWNYTATQLSKELGLESPALFNSILHSYGIIKMDNGTWVLADEYSETGWMVLKQGITRDGEIVYYGKWTDTGREFILKFFNFIQQLDATNDNEEEKRKMVKRFIDNFIQDHTPEYQRTAERLSMAIQREVEG